MMLKRTPIILRVTEFGGKFDALNELDDRPLPQEKLYAYTIAEHRGMAFIDGAKCRGCFGMAKYKLMPVQPTDAQMRDDTLWHDWCVKNDPRK